MKIDYDIYKEVVKDFHKSQTDLMVPERKPTNLIRPVPAVKETKTGWCRNVCCTKAENQ